MSRWPNPASAARVWAPILLVGLRLLQGFGAGAETGEGDGADGGILAAAANVPTPGRGIMGPVIELAGLTKVFGRTRAVDGLTCSVEPGIVTGFLGPNGAVRSLYPAYAMPWGEVGSLLYFMIVVAVVYVAAIVVVNRRDA